MIAWIIYTVLALVVVLYCFFGKTIGHVPDFRKPFSAALLVVYTIIMLVCCSCATSKNTDRSTQVDYSGTLKQVESRMDSLLVNMQMQRKEVSEKLSNIKMENKTVFYSQPDSAGKQYPTQVIETTVNKEDKENKTTDTKIEATMQQLIREVNDLRQQLDASISDKERVKEISWWQLHKVDVYAVLFVVIIVCWIVYKKHNK